MSCFQVTFPPPPLSTINPGLYCFMEFLDVGVLPPGSVLLPAYTLIYVLFWWCHSEVIATRVVKTQRTDKIKEKTSFFLRNKKSGENTVLHFATTPWRNEGAGEGGRPRAQPKEGAQKAEIVGKYCLTEVKFCQQNFKRGCKMRKHRFFSDGGNFFRYFFGVQSRYLVPRAPVWQSPRTLGRTYSRVHHD